MRKLGIVGGIGPASTVEYYTGVIDAFRARRPGQGYPPLCIDSLDLDVMYRLAEAKDWEPFTDRLVASVERLAAAGAEFAAMAANTAHIVFDEVRRRAPLPLVSIVEATCEAALAKGCRRAIIFGTAFTMKSPLFTGAFAARGMQAFVPDPEDQQTIHDIIFPHLQENVILPEEKEATLAIARRMLADHGADALALACTELPLLIGADDLDVPVLDTTRIHIDAIVEYMLAE